MTDETGGDSVLPVPSSERKNNNQIGGGIERKDPTAGDYGWALGTNKDQTDQEKFEAGDDDSSLCKNHERQKK